MCRRYIYEIIMKIQCVLRLIEFIMRKNLCAEIFRLVEEEDATVNYKLSALF